jgi:hypothetical protein
MELQNYSSHRRKPVSTNISFRETAFRSVLISCKVLQNSLFIVFVFRFNHS